MTKKTRKILEFALFLIGLFLFIATIRSVGIEQLRVMLPALKGWGLLFVAVYPLITIPDVLAWGVAFSRDARQKLTFARLFVMRLVGQAINHLTPFLDIGGEFLRVSLAADHFGVDRQAAIASVIVDRSILFFAEVSFWILGLVLAAFFLQSGPIWHAGIFVGVGIFLLLCLALILLQKYGFFLTFTRWLERMSLRPSVFKNHRTSFDKIDREMTSFYQGRYGKFFLSFALHFLGWLVGGVETWIFFRILGFSISMGESVMIEALLQLVRSLSFFIPGNLGTQEAGLAFVTQGMGFHPSLGVAFSLMKRIRQLFWTGVGFSIWGIFQWQKPKAS